MNSDSIKIRLCLGSSCYTRGNNEVLNIMRKYIEDNKLEQRVDFRGNLCCGECNHGPNLTINDTKYSDISASNIKLILDDALLPKSYRQV